MPTLGNHHPSARAGTRLAARHAFVLLDAISALRGQIDHERHAPWIAWQRTTRPGRTPTRQEYLCWLREAGEALAALLDAQPAQVLVPHRLDQAAACAALNVRVYPPEALDRSARIVVDLHGVRVEVARRAGHTAVDLTTAAVPQRFEPVRVRLDGTELTARQAPADGADELGHTGGSGGAR